MGEQKPEKNLERSNITGQARFRSDNTTSANLQVRFSVMPPLIWGNYDILDTDYDTYAVVYGCNNYLVYSLSNIFVLSRKPYAPNSAEFKKITDRAKELFKKNVPSLDFDKTMEATKHENCTYGFSSATSTA